MEKFIWPIRVYIEDTDCNGIVYYPNYLKYFERARTEWFEQWGWSVAQMFKQGFLFVISNLKVDYLKPARLGDRLEVVTSASNLKKTSLVYDQELRSTESPATIVCKAETKVVCVDLTMRPCGLPKELISLLGERL